MPGLIYSGFDAAIPNILPALRAQSCLMLREVEDAQICTAIRHAGGNYILSLTRCELDHLGIKATAPTPREAADIWISKARKAGAQ